MKTVSTKGIVLKRVDYAEADRIVTLLTPDMAQVRAIAKGVRRPKSKLAGGLQLLSVCDVTLMESRGDLKLVRSARIDRHFADIIKDYDRMEFAYQMIESMYVLTSDIDEPDAYVILETGLDSLNMVDIPLAVTQLWFYLHMLTLLGSNPT